MLTDYIHDVASDIMTRTRNTRPTTIYWLVDVRPQTLIDHPKGKPFYCGKTVTHPGKRLSGHMEDACKRPNRPISKMLQACGKHIRIDVVEVVPAEPRSLWCERERFWIAELRRTYPDCLNVSNGGDGVPGLVHSRETRAKLSASLTGRKLSPETCAKMSESRKGRQFSAETRAKISAANKARERSDATRAKLAAAQRENTGWKHSDETRAKMRSTHRKRALTKRLRALLQSLSTPAVREVRTQS